MQKEIRWLLEEKYHHKPTKNFTRDIKRLEEGEPLDYVIGFTEFLGCIIDLSKKPLIPRQETAFWVEQELKDIVKGKVLDIFSGSGCIGLALLKHRGNLLCDFADIEKDNIAQIKINVKKNDINKKRYKTIQSDMFENIKEKYDYIFANPPYVAGSKIKKIQKSVLKYEPHAALFGGSDGLVIIRKFLASAKNYLHLKGKIFMEFSPEQKKEIEKIIKKNRYSSYAFHKDQYGRWRWVSIA